MTEAAQSAPSGGIFDLQGFEWLKDAPAPGGVDMNPDGSPTDQGVAPPSSPQEPAGGSDAPQAPQAPAPQAPAPQAPTEPQVVDPALAAAAPVVEAADAPVPAGVQTPDGGQQAEKLWAKKYQTPEALETAYLEAQRALTQSFQDRATYAREMDDLKQTISQLAPMVQQTWLAANPELAEQYQAQQAIQPLVEQQVAPIRQEMQARQEQQLQAATIQHFYSTHLDVAPNSAEDAAVLSAMNDLDMQLRPDTLEIAYEAAKDPGLRAVLKANPTFIDTDEGVAMARKLARIPDPAQVVAGAQQAVAQTPAPTVAQKQAAAFTESAATGSSQQGAPGPRPDDPWAEAVAAYRAGQQESAFGF